MILKSAFLKEGVSRKIVKLLTQDEIRRIELVYRHARKNGDGKKTSMIDFLDLHRLIVPKRTTLPILENLRVQNKRLTSTNLEVYLTTPTDVKKSGLYAFAGKELRAIKEKISEYPSIHDCNKRNMVFSFTTGFSFIEELAQAREFVSKDQLRPAMLSIYLEPNLESPEAVSSKRGPYRIIATDGHRLFCSQTNFIGRTAFQIPTAIIQILLKSKADQFVFTLYHEKSTTDEKAEPEQWLSVEFAQAKLTARLCVEPYPNYRSVYDSKKKTYVAHRIHRQSLLEMLRRLEHYTSETTHQLILNPVAQSLKLFAHDDDFDKKKEETAEVVTRTQRGFDETKFALVMPVRILDTYPKKAWGVNIEYLIVVVSTLRSEYIEIYKNPESQIQSFAIIEVN